MSASVRQVAGGSIDIVVGDITEMRTDAIVNAANRFLAGGGGVDGAIHRAAGKSVMEETRRLYPAGCPTGEAVTTGAGALSARRLIHAVGPVWMGGQKGEEEQLASAWRASLREAVAAGANSVAFPSISTGAYGFPLQLAARIAIRAVLSALSGLPDGRRLDVVVCAFSERDAGEYRAALEELLA
jgi:O-acetyl-ADP-ribose deacetylase (regulator of RNase III)